MSLILQEMSMEREIEIPEEVQHVYAQWRPSLLHRVRRLDGTLDTPARIYYRYEGVSPAGSHKPNSAVARAYYNKKDGRNAFRRKRGPASGDLLWRWPARSSAWNARFIWCE